MGDVIFLLGRFWVGLEVLFGLFFCFNGIKLEINSRVINRFSESYRYCRGDGWLKRKF